MKLLQAATAIYIGRPFLIYDNLLLTFISTPSRALIRHKAIGFHLLRGSQRLAAMKMKDLKLEKMFQRFLFRMKRAVRYVVFN